MESSSQLSQYPWFDSIEGDILYVKYMNSEVFDLAPENLTLRFAISKSFCAEKYYQVLEFSSEPEQ